MISHSDRLLFIHIPKNAGTTIERWMASVCDDAGYNIDTAKKIDFRLREKGFARAMRENPHYFTFTFVRSPFSRFISTWNHSNRPEKSVGYWARPHIANPHEYLEILASQNNDKMLSKFDKLHAKPQINYIPDTFNSVFGIGVPKKLDFIGRVEFFSLDFDYLRSLIGYKINEYSSFRRAESGNWASSIDRSLYNKITQFYRKDIELLAHLFPRTYKKEFDSWESFKHLYNI